MMNTSHMTFTQLLKNIKFVGLIIATLLSCTQNTKQYVEKTSIIEGKDKIIQLDTESSFELLSLQLKEKENILLTLDAIKNNINIFEWNNGELIEKIPLNIDEKNIIYNPTRFFYHNRDSIFVVDFGENIKLINKKGEIIDEFLIGEIKSKNNEYSGIYGYTQIGNNKNFLFKQNKIFYPTEHLSSQYKRLGIYNINSETLNEIIEPPYSIQNLFENDFVDFWYDLDESTNSLYLSFPLTNSIYKYNLNKNSMEGLHTPILNHQFENHYKPIYNDIRYSNLEPNRISNILNKINSLSRYTSIILTENFIVRLYIHQSNQTEAKARNFTIYIFSKNGELLGEKYFQNPTIDNDILLVSASEDFIFSKRDTLFIPYIKSKPDENKITFKSFTISRNTNN